MSQSQDQVKSGFHYLMSLVSASFMGGVYLDGWAHENLPAQETFFTPWHALLYSGYAGVTLALGSAILKRKAQGYSRFNRIPPGYGVTAVGNALFLVGGVGDFFWHGFFGVEADLETLLSPTHLWLAFSLFLIVGGPWRASRRVFTKERRKILIPALISLTLMMSLINFITEFSHPYVIAMPSYVSSRIERYGLLAIEKFGVALGVTGIILQSGLLMVALILALSRFRLPFGALSLIIGLNGLLLTSLNEEQRLLPAIVLAGLVADCWYARFKPGTHHRVALRLFAFGVPLTLYAGYFLILNFGGHLIWTIHIQAGSCVLAGLAGVGVSYLLIPTRPE